MLIDVSYATKFNKEDRDRISNDIAEKLEFYGYRPVYMKTKNPIMAKRKSAAYLYKRISALRNTKSKTTGVGLVDLRNSEVNAALDIGLLPGKNGNYRLTIQSFEIVTTPTNVPVIE